MDFQPLILRIQQALKARFLAELSPDLVFHNWEHTCAVAESARKIAEGSGFSPQDSQLAEIAGWFHDVGYLIAYHGHEAESMKIASDFLQKASFPEDLLEKVLGAIAATELKLGPRNEFENVLHDADMYHLASPDFFQVSTLLRKEWKLVLGKEYSDLEWLKSNLDFVKGVGYRTPFAIANYEPHRHQLEKNLENQLADQLL